MSIPNRLDLGLGPAQIVQRGILALHVCCPSGRSKVSVHLAAPGGRESTLRSVSRAAMGSFLSWRNPKRNPTEPAAGNIPGRCDRDGYMPRKASYSRRRLHRVQGNRGGSSERRLSLVSEYRRDRSAPPDSH